MDRVCEEECLQQGLEAGGEVRGQLQLGLQALHGGQGEYMPV